MLKILGARLTAGAGMAALLVFSAEAAELQLKRVMLSSGGVGYFEYQAQVEGWETIEIPVRLDQVDDVLKSAVIFDDKGGSGVVELQGRDSLAEIFRTMPVGPELRREGIASNLDLSSRRADTVADTLIALGAPRNIISADGRGEANPVASNATPEGRARNRRIEVTLDAERGGEHRRRQIFGEIRRFFVRRAEAVMLADVAVLRLIFRLREANRRRH